MIGERIRRARLVTGFTQSDVVDQLSAIGVKLTKAGLSKYELGGSIPDASMVLKLAKVLRVRTKTLMEEQEVEIVWLNFRMNASLRKGKQDRIKAIASDVIEKHVRLQETLFGTTIHKFPKRQKAIVSDDAEAAAANLRKSWNLGILPLTSVTGVIEDNGGIAVHVHDGLSSFHGLSGLANRKYPVAITNGDAPTDRIRFNLAHELGHLLMDSSELPRKDAERLAHRFAAAFIVPPSIARQELGGRRKDISYLELASLKKKHGLSMQAWVYRAKDLNIISEPHFNALFRGMSAHGWRKVEPVEFEGVEKPRKLHQMTLRALSEGIISESEALHICHDYQEESEQLADANLQRDVSPIEILKMSRERRGIILRQSAKIMEDEYGDHDELNDLDATSTDFFEDEPDE